MKKALLLTLAFALFVAFGFSQTSKYWSVNNESRSNITKYKAVSRLAFPKEFKLFNLNIEPLRQELFTVVDNASRHSTIISLPNTDGNMEEFEVFESSNFEPALQAEYPQIRAFSGKGITDRYATLKLSISPVGIQTMVFRTNKAEFIERYSEDRTVYAVFTSQRNPGQLPWSCSTDETQLNNEVHAKVGNSNFTNSSAGQLKVMRLAQSVNGEYSNYFGANNVSQIALVYAGINATITRCNGCYEKDLGVHLNIIAGNDPVIFFNAATDPYTTWNDNNPPATNGINDWNGQLLTTLKALVGDANFDIGHMFGKSGGGGNAGCIGCVCGNGTSPNTYKGAGITSPADNIPEGDNFDIDYVVHEVGHQMGGNHTFSFSNEGTGVNKEVGSGITIMGYAGITSQDDSSHSIPYYHEATIAQIQANLATKTCPVTTDISAVNATPVVAPVGNYTIPISTPFQLTTTATDANAGDALTYQWEQDDNASGSQTGAQSAASATKATGPNWLSFNPTATPTRYLPRLTTILTGGLFTNSLAGGTPNLKVEALSSVNRTLHFRCTVRDNSPYVSTAPVSVGQTAFTDMTVTVSNTSGPFAVTQPNTNVSWQAGTTQTITWAVANTTVAPVSCANVKISLSIDGGYTWPIVLVANTANDGTEDVTIPNNVTNTARVVIESVGNIFFDISNTNFTITPPSTGFSFNSVAPATVACGGAASSTATLATTATGGFVTPIALTATGNPAGTTVGFSTNPLAPGSSTDVTLTGVNTLAPGTYNVVVNGTAGSISQNSTISFTVQPGTPPAITAQPVAASVCSGTAATFTVASSTAGVTYQWQVNPGTGFTDIAGATSATYTFTTAQSDNGNLYHVIITYLCGTTTSTDVSLTVNTAANITTQPADFTACANDSHTFSVVATGTGLNYQWQVSTNGGTTFTDITGETNASLTLNNITTSMDGNVYHVVISSATSPCTAAGSSNAVTLTVNPLPVLTATANPTAVCTGNPSTLTATGADSYSWTEPATPGNTITSGANTATPVVTPVVNPGNTGTPNPIVYTVTGTSLGCSSSTTVTVTANPLPVVTISADANTTILPYQTVTLTAAVTPAGSFTYAWDHDGVIIPNNNTNTITVGITDLGDYGVFVSDATGTCGSNSNRITVVDSVNGKFYVYPNPNAGQFVIQVKVPNLIGNVTCFDSKGARVYAQINVTDRVQYQVIDVNLGGASSGVYMLTIYDKAGVRLDTEKVIVRH